MVLALIDTWLKCSFDKKEKKVHMLQQLPLLLPQYNIGQLE